MTIEAISETSGGKHHANDCISYLQEAVYNLLILTNVAQGILIPAFAISVSPSSNLW